MYMIWSYSGKYLTAICVKKGRSFKIIQKYFRNKLISYAAYLRIGMQFVIVMWRLLNRSSWNFMMFKQIVIIQTSYLKEKMEIKEQNKNQNIRNVVTFIFLWLHGQTAIWKKQNKTIYLFNSMSEENVASRLNTCYPVWIFSTLIKTTRNKTATT